MNKSINQLFKTSGVDTIQLRTDKDYIKPLIQFLNVEGNEKATNTSSATHSYVCST